MNYFIIFWVNLVLSQPFPPFHGGRPRWWHRRRGFGWMFHPRPLWPPVIVMPTVVQPQPPPEPDFLNNPRVKQFIGEVEAHTSAYKVKNQGYDKVLAIMQSYYTKHTPSGQTYDGTKIVPNIVASQHSEMNTNQKVTGMLFENDMALTVPQMQQINSNRNKRKITADMTLRWNDNYVPYKFGQNDEQWQKQINEALRYWERETCLKFVQDGPGDALYFDRGSGCYSSVGRLGGDQLISIGYGCETLGIISHEVGHALGFWHEQERGDRDSYVKINLQNAIPGTEGNFGKRSSLELITLDIPYDLGSVMHYAANSFSNESLRYTVDPIDQKYRSTIGNRVAPSFTDIKQINRLYCYDKCSTRMICQNEGYQDPNNCNQCKCPVGLGGPFCNILDQTRCGGDLVASYQWQTLSFSDSIAYCFWRISAPQGGRIRFEITDVYFKCAPTCEEFVEIKHGADMQLTGFRLCCLPITGSIVSQLPYIIVIAKSTVPSRFSIRYIADGIAPPTTAPVARPVGSLTWSEWSAWGQCSERCGACGQHQRQRKCYGNGCSVGTELQAEVCNFNACEQGTTFIRSKRNQFMREETTSSISEEKRLKRAVGWSGWCCAGYRQQNNWCYRI